MVTLLSSANNTGSSTSTPASITLPSGITTGDVAYMFVSVNANAGNNDPNTPSGWSRVAGPLTAGSTVTTTLFRKTVAAHESGVTITSSLPGGVARWSAGCIVVSGGGVQEPILTTSDNAANTSVQLPAFTPISNNAMAIALLGQHYTDATSIGFPALTGWTKLQESTTTLASGVQTGAVILNKQLTGQAGTLQSAVNGTQPGDARENWFVFVINPIYSKFSYTEKARFGT